MTKRKIPAIQLTNGATVCTPDGFAVKARKERLKRTLRNNLKGAKSCK